MTKAHFIHGFNVWDGGAASVDKLIPYFQAKCFDIGDHDYGWVGPMLLRSKNDQVVEEIREHVKDGDILIGHSNGCLICWQLVTDCGIKPAAVICIQAALRKDTEWPKGTPVLNLFNKKDKAVSLGRFWARFWSVANPFRDRHGWGAAGRHGFTKAQPMVINWNTDKPPVRAQGHSGVFETEPLQYWGLKSVQWGAYQSEKWGRKS